MNYLAKSTLKALAFVLGIVIVFASVISLTQIVDKMQTIGVLLGVFLILLGCAIEL